MTQETKTTLDWLSPDELIGLCELASALEAAGYHTATLMVRSDAGIADVTRTESALRLSALVPDLANR